MPVWMTVGYGECRLPRTENRDSATLVGQPQAGIEAGDRGELSLVSEEAQEWGEEYFL
jgi:hypothetical protein